MSKIKELAENTQEGIYYKLYVDEYNHAEVVETYDDWYYDYDEAIYLARKHNQEECMDHLIKQSQELGGYK